MTLGGLLLVVGVLALYIVLRLQHRFGGYDLSPLIDVGWRIVSGQHPNSDFICTFPPLLYLGAAAAFAVFGVHWMALSIASACYTGALTLLGVRILLRLRSRLSDEALLTIAFAYATAQLLPMLLVGHPWHSSWSEGAAAYALLATFGLALLWEQPSLSDWEMLLHLTFAETLLVLAKPNIGLPALLVCTLTLLCRPKLWRAAFLSITASVLLASLILLSVHTDLLTTFRLYLHLDSRLGAGGGFHALFSSPFHAGGLPDLAVYIAIVPALGWSLLVGVRALAHRQSVWIGVLALGSILIATLALGTDVDFRIVDVPCILLGAALLAATFPSFAPRFAVGIFAQGLFSLLLIALFYAQTRARMQAVGQWAAAGCGPDTERNVSFFGDFHGCAAFFSVLDKTDSAVLTHPGAHVFFGPRMEFQYARDHLTSPRGLPLWWHPGSSFPEGALPQIVQAWQDNHFDLLVFLHGDRTRVPGAILHLIDRDYTEITNPASPSNPDAEIDVYVRR